MQEYRSDFFWCENPACVEEIPRPGFPSAFRLEKKKYFRSDKHQMKGVIGQENAKTVLEKLSMSKKIFFKTPIVYFPPKKPKRKVGRYYRLLPFSFYSSPSFRMQIPLSSFLLSLLSPPLSPPKPPLRRREKVTHYSHFAYGQRK